MDKQTKTKIKNLVLELRDDFEKEIENRLNNIGIYPDKEWKDGRSLPHLEKKELENRRRVAAFIKREEKIGIDQQTATKEFIKETSYTWINRLLGLKCMECRDLIEEMITTRPEYGDRSRYHRNFRENHPDLATRLDDGLIPCLFLAFQEVTEEIKVLFDPENEYSLVVPRYPFLKKAIQKINDNLDYDTYREDEFLGWVYQYFNSKEKDRVFEEVRTKKKKIAGSDIINVTQLYTEKYMVRFLVENSLGAMWMEMYPDSYLCRKWEYFVKDPNNSTREPKPVKEITFLDPACGSGHFLLYAFDLYYDMYLEEGIIPKDQVSEFILRHNLHGIDIDLRAIQLSALGLFMKAKSMQPDMKVQHMNLVSADAIMLDSEILEEFLEEFRGDPTAQELIETIWQGLENVRELGSLLKVEEQIDEVIERQKSWGSQKSLDSRDWKEKGWEHWKLDLLAKLKRYYEKAAQTFDINKQMFANEACKGVQLLDLLEQRYDVVATNPPYMGKINMDQSFNKPLKLLYPDSFYDLCTVFIERNIAFNKDIGFTSMITQQTFMFIDSFRKMRSNIIESTKFRNAAHLGPYAFEDIVGEKVNTVMFILKKSSDKSYNKCTFFKLITEKEKNEAIIKCTNLFDLTSIFEINQEIFHLISGKPFVYWLPLQIQNIFKNNNYLSKNLIYKSGIITGNNDKYLRYFWEKKSFNKKWISYHKGGVYSNYYSFPDLIVDWSESAKEFYSKCPTARIRNSSHHFIEGITFNNISAKGINAKYLDSNILFDHNGPALLVYNLDINFVLGLLNSKLFSSLFQIVNPTLHFNGTDVLRMPLITSGEKFENNIANYVKELISLKKLRNNFITNNYEFKQTALQWGYDKMKKNKEEHN